MYVVTGAAGFIGSHLLEALLKRGETVASIDNFETGFQANLDSAAANVSGSKERMIFENIDIRDGAKLRKFFAQIKPKAILHQAALGSVPRSIENPENSHNVNVVGFFNVLDAARQAGVPRVVFASSSSVYGDNSDNSKTEDRTGVLLSPYAATKRMNEALAASFSSAYGMETVGLRYFNVFGPRQDPDGPYAAVVPRWLKQLTSGQESIIYGDGETSRDFCYVQNIVQANILAATVDLATKTSVCNVACGDSTSLNTLYSLLQSNLKDLGKLPKQLPPRYEDFRLGDIRHSRADITRARTLLGYEPEITVAEGIRLLVSSVAATSQAA